MTNMEWCVLNNIAATDLYCMRNNHKKPTIKSNSCYIIKEVHGLVCSEFEDDAINFNKVILDWLATVSHNDCYHKGKKNRKATVFHNDCDTLYEAYHRGWLEGYKARKNRKKKLKK